MAEWRPFGATNDEGTCLWCGKRLRWKRYPAKGWFMNGGIERVAAGERPPMVNAYDRPGDYGDGYFCGLRCAYRFAVSLADAGRRLKRTAASEEVM